MKQIITLGLFVFALLLGTQTVVAQDSRITKTEANANIEAKTIKTVKGLSKILRLDKDQTAAAYKAIKEHDSDIYSIENNKLTEKEILIKSKHVNEQLENKMIAILSKEQFKKYKRIEKN